MHSLYVLASEGGHENGFLWGDTAEMIISAIASIIVIGLLIWKGLPAAKTMLDARSDRLAKELDDAAKANTDASSKLTEVQGRIANAENERQRILVEARQTAEALKQQIVARAEDEAAQLKVRAAADIEATKAQAIADLQAEVGELAMGAAEAVIAHNLDAGTQTDLIEGYITQVGAQA